MKIFVNAKFLTQPITGAQRYAIELSRELKRNYPEIIFVSPPNIIHIDIALELDVQFIGYKTSGVIWEQIQLPFYLYWQERPLLLNLCNIAPIIYNNNIVSILDLSFYKHPEWFSKSFSKSYNIIIPFLAKKAKKIITISESSRNDIIRYYKSSINDVDIVYPGVSSLFLNSLSRNINISSNYGKYILAVSSLDPRKNFIGLIKAFKLAALKDIKLLIVGSEKKVFADGHLRELVREDKSIIFTGYVGDDELVDLYSNAIFFAYPSFFEGFGIPPLEAMACGCPTLVANTTSLPEACGDASLYVDPYDINDIREGIIRLSNDAALRISLISKGYKQVQNFNWANSSQKLAHILKNLIGKENGK